MGAARTGGRGWRGVAAVMAAGAVSAATLADCSGPAAIPEGPVA